jgi:hypothetical protein
MNIKNDIELHETFRKICFATLDDYAHIVGMFDNKTAHFFGPAYDQSNMSEGLQNLVKSAPILYNQICSCQQLLENILLIAHLRPKNNIDLIKAIESMLKSNDIILRVARKGSSKVISEQIEENTAIKPKTS